MHDFNLKMLLFFSALVLYGSDDGDYHDGDTAVDRLMDWCPLIPAILVAMSVPASRMTAACRVVMRDDWPLPR